MSNKKLLQISAEFDLRKKPDWLDNFRKKYDKPFRCHITLKTSTYFYENNVDQIKSEVSEIIKKYTKITVTFDKLFISPSPKGMCIMIRAEANEELISLQKEISTALAKYGEHLTEQHKSFEINFKPHITIGRELSQEQLDETRKELKEELYCETVIDEVVLTIAKEDSFEEWNEPKNKIHYELR